MFVIVGLVGREGLEPSTFRLKGEYSNQLSYRPGKSGLFIT